MTFPTDVGVVDLMVGLPPEPGDMSWRESFRPMLKDRESLEGFQHPASYMFKNLPDERFTDDPVGAVLGAMDRHGVELAMIGVRADGPMALGAVRDHPDRFIALVRRRPQRGRRAACARCGTRSRTSASRPRRGCRRARSRSGRPTTPTWYPIYATCAELGIPIFLCMGVPGPRVPFAPQHVERLDRVCYEFPELTVVTRHGCEPWEALAVKLMLKWPNLYYSTSAFAPKYYPKAIIDYANTRGADKVIYAGYFPFGSVVRNDLLAAPEPRPARPRVAEVPPRERAARASGSPADRVPPEPGVPARRADLGVPDPGWWSPD